MRMSLVMPYYENPLMLQTQMRVWRDEWSDDLKEAIEIIVVDDGSPNEPACSVISSRKDRADFPYVFLYRVAVDLPWHQHGARNLGAHVATAPWLLMTDIDHVVPPSTLREVLSLLPLARREVLTFGRVDAPAWFDEAEDWPEFSRTKRADGSLKPHVNSFVIEWNHFKKTGGYDESYCGIYGCDQEFRTRLWKRATERHLHHAPLIRVDRDVIADASTRGVERKRPQNAAAKKAVRAAKAMRGEAEVIKSLQFRWERVL